MAGRPKGSTGHKLTMDHRLKIENSHILNRLIRHAEGVEEMKQTEVTAGLALLKKVLPDLQAITHETGDGGFHVTIGSEVRRL